MSNFFDDDDENDDVQYYNKSPSLAAQGKGVAAGDFFGSPSPAPPLQPADNRRRSPSPAFNDHNQYRLDSDSPRNRRTPEYGLPPRRRATTTTSQDNDGLGDILGDGFERGTIESGLKRMIRAWRNEKEAPELLHYPTELVTKFARDIAARRKFAKEMTTPWVVDSRTGERKSRSEAHWTQLALVSTEVMRASYILKQLLRQRLIKVERFARYYTQSAEGRDEGRARMHPSEREHARGFVELQDEYYKSCAMNEMPVRVQSLNEPNMVAAPDLSVAVFVHARKPCGPVVLPDSTMLYLEAGSTRMVRYSTIRALLEEGAVELT